MIWRLNSNGTLDTTFNSTGFSALPFTVGGNTASSIAYAGSGKFVIAGYITVTNSDMGIARYEVLYQIDPPTGLTPQAAGVDISLGSANGRYEEALSVNLYKGAIPLADVVTDLNQDLDWSGVTGDTDAANYIAYTHGLYDATGVDGTVTLYVPYRAGDNAVGICPGADSLANVTESCSNLVVKREADTDTSLVTIGGITYWAVTGLTGTGGLSLYREVLPQTGTNILIPTMAITLFMVPAVYVTARLSGKYMRKQG
jgi:hypothetical protein